MEREGAGALKGADAGVLSYAGHGLLCRARAAGENYLVRIDAKAEDLMQCILKALGPGAADA